MLLILGFLSKSTSIHKLIVSQLTVLLSVHDSVATVESSNQMGLRGVDSTYQD